MKKYLLFVPLLFITTLLIAQIDRKSDLYKTIISKDSLLFNVGFNTCDISQFENLLSEKFEFFHDKDSISNKEQFLHNLQNGLCISPTTFQSRRELLLESTEIYPLYKREKLYGVIQIGVHQFFETIEHQKEVFGSSAKFTHLWLLENGVWKLTKSLSYDHQINLLDVTKSSIFDNDKEIEKWLKSNNIPTLGLGVINEGKLQQVKVYGDFTNGKTAPYNTIFNVASLTKPITAIVTLKLASLGKWNLDEPISNYWTDQDVASDPRSKRLTTRHILSHQTGFTNWRGNNKDGKLHFEFEPGTKYQYSGEGFEYLRKALESKFHKTIDQLATELIFEPLQMNDTEFFWSKKTDESRFAIGYNNKGVTYETIKNKSANAADDLLTTIEDYGNFLVSVMNSEGLSKKVFDDMTTNQVETKNGKHFGLGFEIYDIGNGEIALSHGGADNGVQTIVFIFPKIKKGLIIFTNVDDGYKVYEKLISHYLEENGKKIIEIETTQ
ncbi:CubicO group peptidase (beta-lactamase class C family) [Lutibacter oceani]|uniref:CubicO group peptidase (Beta-lactamase class C family) n=1 Tax=Lutibacter oceani TaxID=1853311 RepID=A0A3D9S0J2_9FLAO|nr:serine hydrolase [Lutibacter oceani]REE82876.1 CubicO group peptidase (beta-lactamase class C family) [Lutibacter oceani]